MHEVEIKQYQKCPVFLLPGMPPSIGVNREIRSPPPSSKTSIRALGASYCTVIQSSPRFEQTVSAAPPVTWEQQENNYSAGSLKFFHGHVAGARHRTARQCQAMASVASSPKPAKNVAVAAKPILAMPSPVSRSPTGSP